MPAQAYRIVEGSLQEQFFRSRAKVQMYAGAFANGKTSASCIRALELARDYPGSNGLMARSTYPKLNDTLRKEFLKWCPRSWIKSFPMSANGSNTCTLTNGTTINFRYIAQQGTKDAEATTSNLLSATYDWAVVDQMEDPEITEKDFDDLLGRLRGMTPYAGDDRTMPRDGPRWFILTTNPTRNWLYQKLVKPYKMYTDYNVIDDALMCVRDPHTDAPILDDEDRPQLLLDIVEGSTYDNAANLSPDFIQTLESMYRGSMRERFLLGKWSAYEGLVYPAFDIVTHVIRHQDAVDYLHLLRRDNYAVTWTEGYDHGLAVPSCYLLSYTDPWGNVIELDGFYEIGMGIDAQIERIREIRAEYDVVSDAAILADPSIFRRTPTGTRTIGRTVADMFWDTGRGVRMTRGNNDILNGIIKVSQFLAISKMHVHPITGAYGAPHMFISDKLDFVIDEFSTYIWMRTTRGDIEDKPRDKDDHAMDTLKYQLSRVPMPAAQIIHAAPQKATTSMWWERDIATTAARLKSQRHNATVTSTRR